METVERLTVVWVALEPSEVQECRAAEVRVSEITKMP